MSDTTITAEERARLRSVLSEHGTPQVEDRIILRLLNTIEQAEASALRWTHEPPKVAGKYWWRPVGKKIGRIRDMFVRNGEVGFLDRNDRFIKDTGDGEWAGPIAPPIE